ncbi:DUF6377 domain-containing protein [Chitinophaga sp. Cy-1792]|uniref:DUF6377 domain-containing protein n=1 Tax=Chitinophaga sp. Cy-1792 TaxID=2608339 RepID=UPI0019644A6B|nr:DUF6377 domain-containing protein [Chitinophaga sp. Cy-1792]
MFLLLLASVRSQATGVSDSLTAVLEQAIADKPAITKQKEATILAIKQSLSPEIPPAVTIELNTRLFKEYQKYQIDSAIAYVNKSLAIADQYHVSDWIITSKLQLSNLYSFTDKFLEAKELLETIPVTRLSSNQRADYYEAWLSFYEHRAANGYDKSQGSRIIAYRDSLLSVLDPASNRYKINLAVKSVINRQPEEARAILLPLDQPGMAKTKPEEAMLTYLLGVSYLQQKNNELARQYFTRSAIIDVQTAIKDNASLQGLAIMYHKEGNIKLAYTFTKSVIEDAIFCNIKFRTLSISELYTIINTEYLANEADAHGKLQLYLLLISTLSVFLVISLIYVYKQMQKVSRIKEALDISTQELRNLNEEITATNKKLTESNTQLSESNHIKEVYITQFLDLCSTYIDKLETYRKNLNKLAIGKQLEELYRVLKSTHIIEDEVEGLYAIFDRIFLGLYPNFIQEFNLLLLPEEQVSVKRGELLNTELRVFALIRLGITDSNKIAEFLRYSVSTIYNYRTKTRNKAVGKREEFEKMVMKIGNEAGASGDFNTKSTTFSDQTVN